MKPICFLVTLMLVITLMNISDVRAQEIEVDPQYIIKTRDGNEFIGRIISEDDLKIVLMTEKFGEVSINKLDIVNRELIQQSKIIDGVFWSDNPQSTRYFFGPNGHGIKKGEGYYQNVWIFFNQVTVGVTDNFSFSAGMVPLFLFAGAPTPIWINPKVSVPVVRDKYNIGAGTLVGTFIGGGGSFGILYGVNTIGNRDRNLSLGLGWGFADGNIATSPTISVSGMYRTGPRGYLLTENYIINTGEESFGMISFGGRRIISQVGLDFGLLIPIAGGVDSLIALPWLGLTIPFRNKNPSEFNN